MKNEQLAAQLRLAASILETSHPFEYQNGGYWFRPSTCENMQKPLDYILDKHEIRLALAMPGDGRVLHNPDNLTAEQVGAGWRLVLPGEITTREMQVYRNSLIDWEPVNEYYFGKKVVIRHGSDVSFRLPLSTPWPEAKVEQRPVMVALDWKDILPGSAFKMTSCDFETFMPIFVCPGFVLFHTERRLNVDYKDLKKFWMINRSIPLTGKWDADAWEECSKQKVD